MVLRLTPIFYRRPCNADRQTAFHSSLRRKGEDEKLASLGETPEGGTVLGKLLREKQVLRKLL